MELLSPKLQLETILRHRLPHLLPINIPDDLFTDLNVVDSPISFVPISPLKVLSDQFLNKWDDLLMLITVDLILINEVLPQNAYPLVGWIFLITFVLVILILITSCKLLV